MPQTTNEQSDDAGAYISPGLAAAMTGAVVAFPIPEDEQQSPVEA